MDIKFKYDYEKTPNYCYSDSEALINKMGIHDVNKLHEVEKKTVAIRQYQLIENPVKGNFDLKHLQDIHKFLFHDIYYWAGDIRTVAIAKTDMFCLPQFIESYAKDIFTKLQNENYYLRNDTQTKIKKLVELFADINAMHPFREGNGRTQREFIECLAKVIGIDLDLSPISQDDMIVASHEANNGKISLMHEFFLNNHKILSLDQQITFINEIVLEKTMVEKLLHYLQ
ncbi:Fic/DOC family protein [Amedibacillus sp. YH-ame6]